jgi:hypothetical protein|tara:strand:- start:322 stop:519 length:198 start_codon:yes stop_codon:yes gene_type:complete
MVARPFKIVTITPSNNFCIASQIQAVPVPEVHQAYRNCFERMKKQLIADHGPNYKSKLPQKLRRK